MKSYLSRIAVSAILLSLPLLSAHSQKIAKNGMIPGSFNFQSFTARSANPETDLPYNAPCTDCIEDLQARTAYTRSYKGKDGLVYSQAGYSPINIKNSSGKWVPVDARLKPNGSGVYAAIDQPFPTEIDLSRGSSIKNPYGEIRFNNRPELIWKKTDGSTQSLGKANFSNYTAGDDGVHVIDVWPGIDMEMRVILGGIKTNFIVKQRPQQVDGSYIIRDEFQLGNGLTLRLTDDGAAVETMAGQEAYYISKCIGYDSHSFRANDNQEFEYAIDGRTLDMVIPMSVLQDPRTVYPYTIDPLINSSNTLPQASITGSGYNAACFTGYCAYNMTVPSPANAAIVDVLWSFNYIASGLCWRSDGAITFMSGSCASPNQAGYYWFCNNPTGGTCTGNNIPMYSDVASCMPAPSCTPQNVPFQMRFYRCYSSGTGCSNSCIGAGSPWTMTLVGRTVEVASATANGSSSTSICQGSSATLNANGNFGVAPYTYTWDPGSLSGASVTVSPTSTTTYTLTVTDACSQTSTANVTVNVNPAPATPTITSNAPLCSGQTLNLSTTSSGNYYWTGPNGFTSTSQNPSIPNATAADAGTYSLYIIQAGCSSLAATHNVVVTAGPATPTAGGNSPICAGATLNLTGSGATNYYWTGPNGFTSNLQNPSIPNATTANSGTYSLVSVAGSCTSAVANYNVVVNATPATPAPGSNSPVCVNSTINLTAPSSSGTYVWSGPNGFSSTSQNPSIPNATTANAGTYSVYITENGCASTAGTVTVNVVNPPVTPSFTTNSPVCEGSTITLSGSFYPIVSYVWSGPNGFTASGQNVSIPNATAANAGTYSLSLAASGCTSSATVHTVVINPAPAAPTVGGNSPICSGSALNLTSSGSGAGTYYWTGPNSFTSTTQNPTINPATASNSGAYSGYFIAGGCTSAASVYNVVVNPIPAAPNASSNSPVCVGNPINFTSTTSTTGTYVWTGPNSFSSNIQNPTIASATLADNGTYNLSIVENGCSSAVTSITVNVITPPVTPSFTTNSPVCEGSTITLTATAYPVVNYLWSGPNGYTGTGQIVNITNATAANAGTYSLTLTAAGCTSAAATQTVVVNPTPTAPSVGGNSPVCQGSAINLTATGSTGGSYYWTGPNSYTSTTQNPSIPSATAANAGTYSGYYIANGCTSAAATYTVVVNALPATPTASSNSPVCVGGSISLTTPNVPNATYNWTGPNSYTSNTQNPTIASATAANGGTYNVTVTVNGCSSAQGSTVVVVSPPPTTPQITSNSPICEGATLQLGTSSTSVSYFWTGPAGFTSSSQNPSINGFTSAQAGTYSLYVVVSGCTSNTANTVVQVTSSPSVTYTGPTQVCGNTVQLTASANITPPATISSYDWFAPTSIGSGASLSHTFSQAAPTVVNGVVVATSSTGCKDTVSFAVQLFDVPVAAFSSTDACDGKNAQLNEQHSWNGNETATPSFNWQYNGGTISTNANPTYNFGAPGTYNVTLTVSNSALPSCTNSITQTVTVSATPTLDFTFNAECVKDVTFQGSAAPDSIITGYLWNFGDSHNGTGIQTTHAFDQAGLYNVEFTAITAQGCTTSVTKPVQIDNNSSIPAVPNIFTPNGDNVNDVIDMEAIANNCGDYEFTIFGRWGNVVHTQKNGGAPFTGKNLMGGMVTPGVYFYVLMFNGQKSSGTLTIIR